MENPYCKKLRKMKGVNVTIHRKNAPNVEGNVGEIKPWSDGVEIIKVDKKDPEAVTKTFIAFKDICGIETGDWNYDVIS